MPKGEKFSLTIAGATYCFFLSQPPRGNKSGTLLIGAPQLLKESGKPPGHACVFVDNERLVILAADETRPERTAKRHTFRLEIPLDSIAAVLERITQEAPAWEERFRKSILSHVTCWYPRELAQFEFICNLPLSLEAIEAAAKGKAKKKTVDMLEVFSKARIVKGNQLGTQGAGKPAVLIAQVPGQARWIAPFMVMGWTGDGRVVLVHRQAFIEVAKLSNELTREMLKVVPGIADHTSKMALPQGRRMFRDYPFSWDAEHIDRLRALSPEG